MDANRFEKLLRSLSAAPSRRGAVGLLVGSTLGGLLTIGAPPIAAKKKGKTKKKKGRAQASPPPPTQSSPPPPGPPPPPPGPTCTDSVKNGLESDVDCGGPCSPCGDGKSCNHRGDCESAFCNTSATCSLCGSNADCPRDSYGACGCVNNMCRRGVEGRDGSNCSSFQCPAGSICLELGTAVVCHKPCGTP